MSRFRWPRWWGQLHWQEDQGQQRRGVGRHPKLLQCERVREGLPLLAMAAPVVQAAYMLGGCSSTAAPFKLFSGAASATSCSLSAHLPVHCQWQARKFQTTSNFNLKLNLKSSATPATRTTTQAASGNFKLNFDFKVKLPIFTGKFKFQVQVQVRLLSTNYAVTGTVTVTVFSKLEVTLSPPEIHGLDGP